MFGHPGISAFEFAGVYQEAMAARRKEERQQAMAIRRETNPTTHSDTGADEVLSELESKPLVLYGQQRTRGTFINHTPRNKVNRQDATIATEEPQLGRSLLDSSCLSQVSRRDYAPPPIPTESYVCNTVSCNSQVSNTPAVNEWRPAPPPKDLDHEVRRLTADRLHSQLFSPIPSSSLLVTPVPDLSLRGIQAEPSSNSPTESSQANVKRVRRQTPYKMPGRHAPLEPLIAYHRRKASEHLAQSQERIEAIGEQSASMAIQEYFDSQEDYVALSSSKSSNSRHYSSEPPSVPLPHSPEIPRLHSPELPIVRSLRESIATSLEELQKATELQNLIEDGLQRSMSHLPDRNPMCLTSSPIVPVERKPFQSSIDQPPEFASAAQGSYSPYDGHYSLQPLNIPRRRKNDSKTSSTAVLQASKTKSPARGRMAPPILDHEALTAVTNLDDLNFSLENTRPRADSKMSEPRRKVLRKKKGTRLFKVNGRKGLSGRTGTVEGTPSRRPSKRTKGIPSVARQAVTSSGTKHLQIIPKLSDEDDPNQSVTMLTSTADPSLSPAFDGSRSQQLPLTFTEEMLNPLGSAAVEQAIAGTEQAPFAKHIRVSDSGTVVRAKSRRLSPEPELVEDHPLATRSEQTRARKLRHLAKFRSSKSASKTSLASTTVSPRESGDRISGAPSDESVSKKGSLVQSLESGPKKGSLVHSDDSQSRKGSVIVAGEERDSSMGSPAARSSGDVGKGGSEWVVHVLRRRVVELQRQNTELCGALAEIMGAGGEGEGEERELDAESLLRVFRQCQFVRE
ncbi:hypothetical protein EJ04DRAFT_574499 [Polyplosphaeria fusca]|uniref:Uncharacterized protein n=1 Tax=Polyplosphaeria fusca TaxID=682080 RepID=A0A9P4R6X0_9PLEO|nr:hypothetical protein EJ04DRAFT_574499 [Polyplosphaeria fusca]